MGFAKVDACILYHCLLLVNAISYTRIFVQLHKKFGMTVFADGIILYSCNVQLLRTLVIVVVQTTRHRMSYSAEYKYWTVCHNH